MLTTYTQEICTFRSKEKPSFSLQYILAKPADLQPEEKLPFVVFMHGAGERGTDIQDIKRLGIPKYLDEGLPFDRVTEFFQTKIFLSHFVPESCILGLGVCNHTVEIE